MSALALKKKIKPGKVEAAPSEIALLVNYDKEVHYDDGKIKSKRYVENIPINPRDVGAAADIQGLATDVIQNCKYISSSSRTAMEMVMTGLRVLQQRVNEDTGRTTSGGGGGGGGGADRDRPKAVVEELPIASIEQLDEYQELLYDDEINNKVHATACILSLSRNVGDLEVLVQNESLMALLSRLLADEYKKSMEMTYNILKIYLALSNFVEMHPILSKNQIGALTMKVLTFETSRAKHNKEETDKFVDNERALKELDDNPDEDRMAVQKKRDRLKREMSKSKAVKLKSEKLIAVCFHLLLNLAENQDVEMKMLKKGLIETLLTHLDYTVTCNLAIMLVVFLKKLSMYEVNMQQMTAQNVTSRLTRYVPCNHDVLTNMTLRLLFNLSFDSHLREQMVKESLIPKLVEMLQVPKYRGQTLKLLYHLSYEDRVKALMGHTDAIQVVMQLIIKFPEERHLGKELAALAINLSLNAHNAEQMCHFPKQNRGLHELIERVERTHDPLLMKVIRNLSQWTQDLQANLDGKQDEYEQRGMWGRFMDQLLSMACHTPDIKHDLLVEVLGTLANMTPLDLPRAYPWKKYMKEYDLTQFISKLLIPGMSQHDIVLEVVMLVGAMLADSTCVSLIASSDIIRYLHEVWRDKSDDDEIQLQLLFTFHRMLCHDQTREELLYGSERAVVSIMSCVDSRNSAIRETCEACLSLILEHDRQEDGSPGQLGRQVLSRRFAAHNAEWLEQMDRQDMTGNINGNFNSGAGGFYGGGGGMRVGGVDSSMAGRDRRYGSWNDDGEGKYGGGAPSSPDEDEYGDGSRGYYMGGGAEEKHGMGMRMHGGADDKMGLDHSFGDSEGLGSSSGGMDDYGRWQN